MIQDLPEAQYYTLVITVPEKAAEPIRDALATAGAGKFGNYTHCTFSVKGIGRYKPTAKAHPYMGDEEKLIEMNEERIETICAKEYLEQVLKAIKEAHPYESTVIDIYPVYKIGLKLAK